MLGYRSFVTVADQRDEVVKRALEQLYSWLRRKGYDADALVSGEMSAIGDGVDGVLVEERLQDGAHWVRARIVERKPSGRWTSELTVGVPGRGSATPWIWLDVDSPEGEKRTRWTGTPRLSRQLAEVFDARDGMAILGPSPSRVTDEEIEGLLDVIQDEDRRGLVFIAGSDHRMDFDPWVKHVTKLLNHTVGLSAAYVLDPAATERFQAAAGASHAVPPWTIRTYRPGADVASTVDGLKHRILSLDRITADDDSRIARMLGWKAREAAQQAPLSGAVLRVNRLLEHVVDQILVTRLVPVEQRTYPADPGTAEVVTESSVHAPPPSAAQEVIDEAEAFLALSTVLGDLVGDHALTVENVHKLTRLAQLGRSAEANRSVIAERLDILGEQVDSLTDERDHLRRRLEDEQLDHAETADDLVLIEEQVRHLRGLILVSDRVADAWTEPESREVRPASYRDLLDRVLELVFVDFTGDESVVLSLEDHDPLFTWGGKVWSVLCALQDYARASADGRCPRDVDGYLRHLPDGCRGYSANRHARDESEDVHKNEQFRRARVLPVPVAVATEGRVFMGAHFKIAQSGLVSPRLHYFDDTARTARVYVGHIGPHLPTKRTN